RNLKHVVKDKRDPLARGELVEHDQQGQSNRVGKESLVLWVGAGVLARQRFLGSELEVFFRTCSPRLQDIQTESRDHRPEPAAQVLDLVRIRPTESYPSLLDGLLSLGMRSENPIGERIE